MLWARRESIPQRDQVSRRHHLSSGPGTHRVGRSPCLAIPTLTPPSLHTCVCLFVLCVQVERRSPANAQRAIVRYLSYFPQVLRAPAGDLPVEVVPHVSLPAVLQYARRVANGRRAPFHRDDATMHSRFEDLYWPMSQARLRRLNRWRQHKVLTSSAASGIMSKRAPRLPSNVDNSDCEGYNSASIRPSERRVARAILGPHPVLEDDLGSEEEEEKTRVNRRLRLP